MNFDLIKSAQYKCRYLKIIYKKCETEFKIKFFYCMAVWWVVSITLMHGNKEKKLQKEDKGEG